MSIFSRKFYFGLGGTRCPPARRSNAKAAQRVGKIMRAPPPDVLAPSAIHVPSVRAGLAFFGEADPPLAHGDRTRWLAWVERVVLNALATVTAALRPDISAFAIVLPSSSGEADPP
jgi:hypothetical protein